MFRKRLKSLDDEEKTTPNHDLQPVTFIENESMLVWRFPIHVSQSSIGGKTELSNACTLIAVKIAELIYLHNVDMPGSVNFLTARKTPSRVPGGADVTVRQNSAIRNLDVLNVDHNRNLQISHQYQKCPPRIISCLVNGIIDGNEAYLKDAGEDSTRVYNLPDAIRACNCTFVEVDFKLSSCSITHSLPKLINAAIKCTAFHNERRLVFIMIGCIRTVLIVFDRLHSSLTLFDTHMHMWCDGEQSDITKHGALIGTCHISQLNSFAEWIQHVVFPDIKKTSEEFEISLVQLSVEGSKNAKKECFVHQILKDPIRFPVFHTQQQQEDRENKKGLAYPVLRSLLSRPPLMLKTGVKRAWDVKNGGESGTFLKSRKEARWPTQHYD